MIDQLPFSSAQHLLRQRGEVSENPQQIRALFEVGLNISRPDRRINLQDAVGEFFDPHGLAYLDDTVRIALPEPVIIAPDEGDGKESFIRMPIRVDRRIACLRRCRFDLRRSFS